MKIVKLEHAGFYLEKDGRGVLFDPVEITGAMPEFGGDLDAVVITHKHSDHLQPEILNRILEVNPNCAIYTTEDNAANIQGSLAVRASDVVTAGVFKLEFYGTNNHAEVFSGQVPCENIGVIIDDVVMNPGDSFDVPFRPVKVLFMPIAAPWLKAEEVVRFMETVRPEVAVNMHDGLLSEMGLNIMNGLLSSKAQELGVDYRFLRANESIEF